MIYLYRHFERKQHREQVVGDGQKSPLLYKQYSTIITIRVMNNTLNFFNLLRHINRHFTKDSAVNAIICSSVLSDCKSKIEMLFIQIYAKIRSVAQPIPS